MAKAAAEAAVGDAMAFHYNKHKIPVAKGMIEIGGLLLRNPPISNVHELKNGVKRS